MIDLIAGRSVMVTGIADEPDGALRVYVGPRYRGIYTLVDDEKAKAEIRRGWGHQGHLFVTKPPPEALYSDAEGCDTKEDA